VEHDRHVCGVFDRATWLRLLEESGFTPELQVTSPDHVGGELFVAVKGG
jgi:hypothetical protein